MSLSVPEMEGIYAAGGILYLRMYLRLRWYTMYILTRQVAIQVFAVVSLACHVLLFLFVVLIVILVWPNHFWLPHLQNITPCMTVSLCMRPLFKTSPHIHLFYTLPLTHPHIHLFYTLPHIHLHMLLVYWCLASSNEHHLGCIWLFYMMCCLS